MTDPTLCHHHRAVAQALDTAGLLATPAALTRATAADLRRARPDCIRHKETP